MAIIRIKEETEDNILTLRLPRCKKCSSKDVLETRIDYDKDNRGYLMCPSCKDEIRYPYDDKKPSFTCR